jgi:hypothetical protein
MDCNREGYALADCVVLHALEGEIRSLGSTLNITMTRPLQRMENPRGNTRRAAIRNCEGVSVLGL